MSMLTLTLSITSLISDTSTAVEKEDIEEISQVSGVGSNPTTEEVFEDSGADPFCHGHSVLRLFLKSLSLDMIRWHMIVG